MFEDMFSWKGLKLRRWFPMRADLLAPSSNRKSACAHMSRLQLFLGLRAPPYSRQGSSLLDTSTPSSSLILPRAPLRLRTPVGTAPLPQDAPFPPHVSFHHFPRQSPTPLHPCELPLSLTPPPARTPLTRFVAAFLFIQPLNPCFHGDVHVPGVFVFLFFQCLLMWFVGDPRALRFRDADCGRKSTRIDPDASMKKFMQMFLMLLSL